MTEAKVLKREDHPILEDVPIGEIVTFPYTNKPGFWLRWHFRGNHAILPLVKKDDEKFELENKSASLGIEFPDGFDRCRSVGVRITHLREVGYREPS